MKKFWIFLISFILLILILLIFYSKINKNEESGNNNNNILNMSSYKANIEVTIKSNKNTNKYKMLQEYKKGEYSKQVVEEPEQIYGLTVEYKDNNLKVENTKLNLTNIYENYNYITENNLFLNEFVEDYNNSDKREMEEKSDEIILYTNCRNSDNKYQANKILTIDKETNKPKKLEVQDINKNTTIYILYNEISYK